MNKILSVSQLNNYIKTVFEDELLLHDITVQGEVFEIKFSGANTFVTIKRANVFCRALNSDRNWSFP